MNDRQGRNNAQPPNDQPQGSNKASDSDDDFVATKKVFNSPPKLSNVEKGKDQHCSIGRPLTRHSPLVNQRSTQPGPSGIEKAHSTSTKHEVKQTSVQQSKVNPPTSSKFESFVPAVCGERYQQQEGMFDSDSEPQIVCQTHIELVEVGTCKGERIVYKPKRWINSIGRSPNFDLVANSIFVSREQHASVVFDPVTDKLILTDCGSANGTYVNDEQVTMVELHQGDLIGVGCPTTQDCIDDPKCIVLRVTQQVVKYPKEEWSSDQRPKVTDKVDLTVDTVEPSPLISRAASSAAINNAMPPPTPQLSPTPEYGSEWDTDGEAFMAQQRAKRTGRKRPARTIVSDDSDDDFVSTTKRSSPTTSSSNSRKTTATAAKTQQRTGDNENGYRALIESHGEEISFLGNVFDKTVRRFVCPFERCPANYSSFNNLRAHFKDHTKDENLQKPIDTDTNNWRRIQNANKRFDMTTIKQKLRPLIIDGETLSNKLRVPEPLATEKTEVATKVFDLINQQAVELSKLAILFSSLAYFEIYNTMRNEVSDSEIDRIFEKEFNWKAILLEFKLFKRNTANAKKERPDKHNPFFELCRKYRVNTGFEETSQNAWHNIADTFASNFKTNITTHLYSRLRNWIIFKLRNGKKKKDVSGKENRKVISDKVYHTMKFLFDSEKCSQPTRVQHEIVSELQKICKFPNFNNRGRSYFERLRYDFKEDGGDDDDNEGQPKRKRKRIARKTTTKKSNKKKTQNNGPRLHWFQMVPAMVRLQHWIHDTNMTRKESLIAAGIIIEKKKRKRKRKRPQKSRNESKPEPPASTENRRHLSGKKKKRDIDPEATHHAKLSNFIVVPQHTFHTMHFPIDTKALFDILKTLPQFNTILNQAEFLELLSNEDPNRKTTNPFWYFMFKISKMETGTKKFGGRITTNGSDVSIQYCKLRKDNELTKAEIFEMARNRKRKSNNSDSESESEDDDDDDSKTKKNDPAIVTALKNVANLEDLSVSGVDLGIRNTAATVIRTWHKSTTGYEVHESNILHKSKDYHHKAGFPRRQRKAKKLHGEFDQRYQEDRQSYTEEPSQRSPEYMKFLNSRLKWFNEGTDAYMQRVVTNVKFDKFRSTQKQMTTMAKEIVGEATQWHSPLTRHSPKSKKQNKLRVVFVGNCSTPANSTIKGHRRSPGNVPIVRYLKQIPRTFVDATIDEYCTTKKCSRCYETLDNVEFSKERLKLCHNCKPASNSMSANVVSTYRRKRDIATAMIPITMTYPIPTQTQRAERVKMERMQRWSTGDRARLAKRNELKSTCYNINTTATLKTLYWNRDGNAARNIAQLGLCGYNQCLPIDFNKDAAFQRPKKN